jgi:hypothetical protein
MLVRTSKDKDHPYVMLNKTFLDDVNLSLKAKGLLAYCMCKHDAWEFHIEQLVKVLKEGKDAIYAAFKELIQFGYCVRTQKRDSHGRMATSDYILFETPQSTEIKNKSPQLEKPYTENPVTENPLTENPPLIINECSNNERNNNKQSSNVEKSVVVPSFIQEIEGITHKDKLCLAEIDKSNPGRVKPAIEWAKTQKVKTTRMALIRWHAEREDELPIVRKKGDPILNKHYANVVSQELKKPGWKVDLGNTYVTISSKDQPLAYHIDYKDIEFEEKISKLIKNLNKMK